MLQRLFSQELAGSFEILVIDSGSTDDTLVVAQNFPTRITRINPEDFHHGKTRNLGAELASGRILVYLTQDALPISNDWLKKLTDAFGEPNVAMVCGRQLPWQSSKPPEKFFRTYHFPEHRVVVNGDKPCDYHDNIFISDVNSAIRNDIRHQFRFSEKIIMTEDREIADRLLAAGWSIVYEPGAAVYHAHDLSLREAFRRSLDYGVSLRQGARPLPLSRQSTHRRLFDYSVAEIKYLKATGCLHWLPYCIIYDLSRYLGTFWGKYGWAKSRGS